MQYFAFRTATLFPSLLTLISISPFPNLSCKNSHALSNAGLEDGLLSRPSGVICFAPTAKFPCGQAIHFGEDSIDTCTMQVRAKLSS